MRRNNKTGCQVVVFSLLDFCWLIAINFSKAIETGTQVPNLPQKAKVSYSLKKETAPISEDDSASDTEDASATQIGPKLSKRL